VLADLRQERARFALVGGFAVSVRTEPRFTRDLDLAVAVRSDAESEALVRGLQARGYEVFMVLEQRAVGRMATARLRKSGPGGEPLVVDLLFASSGVEVELVEAATEELIPGVGGVPVATCGFLIALKLLSRRDDERPNDAADLRALLRVAGPEDVLEARRAVALIAARGFHRGRDLEGLLAKGLADTGGV
jgi:predicted nucleotidyltransferase